MIWNAQSKRETQPVYSCSKLNVKHRQKCKNFVCKDSGQNRTTLGHESSQNSKTYAWACLPDSLSSALQLHLPQKPTTRNEKWRLDSPANRKLLLLGFQLLSQAFISRSRHNFPTLASISKKLFSKQGRGHGTPGDSEQNARFLRSAVNCIEFRVVGSLQVETGDLPELQPNSRLHKLLSYLLINSFNFSWHNKLLWDVDCANDTLPSPLLSLNPTLLGSTPKSLGFSRLKVGKHNQVQ